MAVLPRRVFFSNHVNLHFLRETFSLIRQVTFKPHLKKLAFYIMPMIAVQLIQYRKNDLLAVLTMPLPLRVILYTVLFYLITVFGLYGTQHFMYMQF